MTNKVFNRLVPFYAADRLHPPTYKHTIPIQYNIFAASERSEREATLIWPSRTVHLYIAVSILDFFLARDISFYEYVVHRSAVKRDSVRPHAGLPDILSVWLVGI